MEIKIVCSNPWCKAHFFYKTSDDFDDVYPEQCLKCRSFSNELSGGIEWKDKSYEGDRNDGSYHQIKYKVTNFK